MPEILTESFCERCGTRYTFESAAPTKTQKLGRFKTISKGLKNYVMSDDTSLDEAMAAARSDDELEQTAQQLDAFHATFNFCMNCRQYTCGNCWNEAEGQCLTCAPHLGHEIMPAPFPEMPAPVAEIGVEAWPETDLRPEAVVGCGRRGRGSPPRSMRPNGWTGCRSRPRTPFRRGSPKPRRRRWRGRSSAAVEAVDRGLGARAADRAGDGRRSTRRCHAGPAGAGRGREPSIDLPVEAAIVARRARDRRATDPLSPNRAARRRGRAGCRAEAVARAEPRGDRSAPPAGRRPPGRGGRAEDLCAPREVPAGPEHRCRARGLRGVVAAQAGAGARAESPSRSRPSRLPPRPSRTRSPRLPPRLHWRPPRPSPAVGAGARRAAAEPEPVAAEPSPTISQRSPLRPPWPPPRRSGSVEPEPVAAADADVAAAPEPEPRAGRGSRPEPEPVAAERRRRARPRRRRRAADLAHRGPGRPADQRPPSRRSCPPPRLPSPPPPARRPHRRSGPPHPSGPAAT